MRPIITVQGLSKRYRLGKRDARYQTLRETLAKSVGGWMQNPRARLTRGRGRRAGDEDPDLWALREVSFDVQPGEVLGLIGRNGAGKSTLLKILSRITDPTTGKVELYGRVGCLLEVGTGFHPELTGRENIFLSGAILGMRRMEIARKLEEIVAFAEVEKFLDTPVKRYSSGMFVRLAFAVAAHLEPEILLVDEVLAVGDLAFQKRCLGKMGDVAREGRTVLFVSHNMASIEALCKTCLFMRDGRVIAKGETRQMISHYVSTEQEPQAAFASLATHPGRRKGSFQVMQSVELCDGSERVTGAIRMGESLSVSVAFMCNSNPIIPVLGLVIKNSYGVAIFGVNNKFIGGYRFDQRIPAGVISCRLDDMPLLPGRYSLDIYLGDGSQQDVDVIYDAISLEVLPADVFGTGQLPPAGSGFIFWPASFAVTNGSVSEH